MEFNQEALVKEVTFRTSRSSGAGGQNVNKVETRVEALLNIPESTTLSELQKARISARLKNRINSEGVLAVSCAETRSQGRNRQIATDRLLELIHLALEKKKIRKKSGIPKSVKRKRLDSKKKQSEKKSRRRFDP
ncbi:MAG: aminoacyl-tRNA hydrolase [Flavobacteriales bacterium]|jgi:ribosome-associated protein|nr:aminoacyl-tRNA hydrolase [Flavobacteriales bacterium]